MGLRVIALHGLLGGPDDWEAFRREFPAPIEAIDYTRIPELAPGTVAFSAWGHAFGQWLSRTGDDGDLLFLIGYSQGGRLALQALAALPERIAGLILLSANPGLEDGDTPERQARRLNDEAWARRFESDPWDQTLQSWNAQPVFAGARSEPCRHESPEARSIAAASLRTWGLAHQPDLSGLIVREIGKILFVAGEQDRKYVELGRGLAARSGAPGSLCVIPQAGHRVLLEAPREVARAAAEFFAKKEAGRGLERP